MTKIILYFNKLKDEINSEFEWLRAQQIDSLKINKKKQEIETGQGCGRNQPNGPVPRST